MWTERAALVPSWGTAPERTEIALGNMNTLRIIFLGVNIVALVAVMALYVRLRKAERKRRVEAPNSRYKSPYVEDLEARERWEGLDLDHMHRVNRDEVERILSKLRATSVRALSETERTFLDRMVEAERRLRARPTGSA